MEEILEKINFIRRSITEIFSGFYRLENPYGSQILEYCYNIAIALGSDEKLMTAVSLLEKEEDKQLLLRQWETAVDCLDQLYSITGDDVISAADM